MPNPRPYEVARRKENVALNPLRGLAPILEARIANANIELPAGVDGFRVIQGGTGSLNSRPADFVVDYVHDVDADLDREDARYAATGGSPLAHAAIRKLMTFEGDNPDGHHIILGNGQTDAMVWISAVLSDSEKTGGSLGPVYPYWPQFGHNFGDPDKTPFTIWNRSVHIDGSVLLFDQPRVEQIVNDILAKKVRYVALTRFDNPTGQIISPEVITPIAQACAEVGVVLYVDDAYTGLIYDGSKPFRIWSLVDNPSLAIPGLSDVLIQGRSFSKTIAKVCGWRAGWITTRSKYLYDDIMSEAGNHLGPNLKGQRAIESMSSDAFTQEAYEQIMEEDNALFAHLLRELAEGIREVPGAASTNADTALYTVGYLGDGYDKFDMVRFARFALEKSKVIVNNQAILPYLAPLAGFCTPDYPGAKNMMRVTIAQMVSPETQANASILGEALPGIFKQYEDFEESGGDFDNYEVRTPIRVN